MCKFAVVVELELKEELMSSSTTAVVFAKWYLA